jgi:hypothetical protein
VQYSRCCGFPRGRGACQCAEGRLECLAFVKGLLTRQKVAVHAFSFCRAKHAIAVAMRFPAGKLSAGRPDPLESREKTTQSREEVNFEPESGRKRRGGPASTWTPCALDYDDWSTVQHRRARTQPWPTAEPLAHSATHSGAHVDDAGARSLAEGGGAEPDAAQKIFSKVVDCGFIRCSRPKSSSCTSPLTLVICGSGPSLSLGRHCR